MFGGGACRVESCRRSARGHGLCQGHHLRWVGEGRPDLGVFAASTDPRWRRQRPNAGCRVAGCGYGVARGGMCQLHYQRWDRAGRPDLHGWLADPPTIKTPQPGRGLPDRALRSVAAGGVAVLPQPTPTPGRPTGDPTSTCSSAGSTRSRPPRRRSSGWAGSARSCVWRSSTRCSAATTSGPRKTAARRWSWRWCGPWPPTDAVSLLDRTEDEWRTRIGRPAPRDSTLRALLIYARRQVCRPRRRRRLGGRVRPRRLADAPPRVRRQPAARLHRNPAAVAAGPGQAVAALAARAPGSGWRPPAAGCAP